MKPIAVTLCDEGASGMMSILLLRNPASPESANGRATLRRRFTADYFIGYGNGLITFSQDGTSFAAPMRDSTALVWSFR